MTPGDSRPEPHELERHIGGLRDELGELVGELDRRRRELFDVRAQARQHPVALTLVGVAAAVVVGGAVATMLNRGRRRRRPAFKARQLRAAMQRIVEHPERVARGEPPPSEKILTAIGVAAAGILVKRALERAVAEGPPPKSKPPPRSGFGKGSETVGAARAAS